MACAACVDYALTLILVIALAEGVRSQVVSATAATVTWQTAAAQYLPSTGHFVPDDTSPSADCSNEELYQLELDNLALPTLAINYTVAVAVQAHASQSHADALLFTFGSFAITVNRPGGTQAWLTDTVLLCVTYAAAVCSSTLQSTHCSSAPAASSSLLPLDLLLASLQDGCSYLV
jgi:hypothetical protein